MVCCIQNPVNPSKNHEVRGNHLEIWLMCTVGTMLVNTERKLAILMSCMVVAASWNAWKLNLKYLQHGFIRVNEFYFCRTRQQPILDLRGSCFVHNLAYFLSTQSPWRQFAAAVLLAVQVHQILILESRGQCLAWCFAVCFRLTLCQRILETITAVVAIGLAVAVWQVHR